MLQNGKCEVMLNVAFIVKNDLTQRRWGDERSGSEIMVIIE